MSGMENHHCRVLYHTIHITTLCTHRWQILKQILKKKNGGACTGFSGFPQALLNMVMNFWVPQNEEIP
jgi:hypothetical protein